MALNVTHLQQWLGKTEHRQDKLTIFPMQALAATLERAHSAFDTGSAIPPLWHWAYFLTPSPQSQLAQDGHAKKGDFLPPVPLPRRMWAGGRFHFHQPLSIGQQAQRKSKIKGIDHKQGRGGDLVFVCVQHQFSVNEALAFTEEHDIVYRDHPAPSATPAKTTQAPATADFHREFTPDPMLLFRYSALTFNSHRIHYDREYATNTEGYPGLIVHGPLLATLLVELVQEKLPTFSLGNFEFRAMHPVYDTHSFVVCGKRDSATQVSLWIKNHEDVLCMKASAQSA